MKNKKEKLAALQSILSQTKKSSPVLSITIAQSKGGETKESEEEDEDVDMDQPAATKKR